MVKAPPVPFGQGSRLRMLGLGLITTVLWASSFVLIKIGLGYMNVLPLAGVRYSLAFLILLPLALKISPASGWRFPAGVWLRLALAGIAAYPLANGMLFWGLTRISPTTSSFLFNLTPFFVLLLGIVALREAPTRWQGLGFALVAAGIAIFFALPLGEGERLGIAITAGGAVSFAFFTVLARGLARDRRIGSVLLTTLPLGFGGGLLLVLSFVLGDLPRWDPFAALVVFWLAAVNTALANVVWMRAIASLKAFELSILMNVMPAETALIAWLVMGEEFTPTKVVGIVLVVAGILLVQRPAKRTGS